MCNHGPFDNDDWLHDMADSADHMERSARLASLEAFAEAVREAHGKVWVVALGASTEREFNRAKGEAMDRIGAALAALDKARGEQGRTG